jgi:FAD/FMN-containing dehydrogenase
VELRQLGGELGRPRPQHGALASIEGQYLMVAGGPPNPDTPVRAHVEAVKEALAPWAARQMYLNFAETQREAATFWTEEAYHRLRHIKAAVDPDNIIRSNHPVPPANDCN